MIWGAGEVILTQVPCDEFVVYCSEKAADARSQERVKIVGVAITLTEGLAVLNKWFDPTASVEGDGFGAQEERNRARTALAFQRVPTLVRGLALESPVGGGA